MHARTTHFLAVTLALAIACSSTATAQTTIDDLILYDPTPQIAFDDSNSNGRNYRIFGYDQYFMIRDENGTTPFFRYDPANYGTAVGRAASANGDSSIALGEGASAEGSYSSSLGRFASSDGFGSVAMGYNATVTAVSGIAIGRDSESSSGVALGYGAQAVGPAATALGSGSSAPATRSVALGYAAYAPNPDTVVIGQAYLVNGASAYANVGMGTPTPTQAVDVERSGEAARFQLTSFTDSATEAPQYIQRRSRGSVLAPTAVLNNDNLGLFSFRGYNGTVMGGSRATITAQAAGNFTGSSTPTRLIFATTPVGQTTPLQVMVITPDGKVQVNGQNLDVPDYVFEDDYELMPLDELRTFIDENGHLPGIASASEVNEGGLDLAGSHLDHLRKIEELTLYTLAQEEHIEEQRSRIERLETELSENESADNAALIARVAQLEQLVSRLLPGSGIAQN